VNKFGVAAAFAVFLLSRIAVADPAHSIHTLSPTTCHSDGGSAFSMGPSYHVTEDDWQRMDKEMRRLQDHETQLEVERDSYRNHAHDGIGWGTISIVVAGIAVGAAGGYYLGTR
jgi:hypothetical protein